MHDELLTNVQNGTYSLAELMALMEQNWPEALAGNTALVLSVIRMGQIVTESATQIAAKYGLTQAAFEALSALRAMPEPRQMTPTQLYRAAFITSGGMTKMLKHMEESGYITRHDNPDDRRSRFVRLTDDGAALIEACMSAVINGDEEVLSRALDRQEQQKLQDLLARALGRLES